MQLENSEKINALIEININMFITNDDNKNNIVWINNNNKTKLNARKIEKLGNYLIVLDENVFFMI